MGVMRIEESSSGGGHGLAIGLSVSIVSLVILLSLLCYRIRIQRRTWQIRRAALASSYGTDADVPGVYQPPLNIAA